ncbi:hypothetical protein KY284_012852 [Solanum tuberosum]|nr:hypothetical protein KY284_012852 [Solanum tuberosum]
MMLSEVPNCAKTHTSPLDPKPFPTNKSQIKLLEDMGSRAKHASIHSSASPGELESSLLLMLQRARIINLDESSFRQNDFSNFSGEIKLRLHLTFVLIYSIVHHNSYEGVDGKKVFFVAANKSFEIKENGGD